MNVLSAVWWRYSQFGIKRLQFRLSCSSDKMYASTFCKYTINAYGSKSHKGEALLNQKQCKNYAHANMQHCNTREMYEMKKHLKLQELCEDFFFLLNFCDIPLGVYTLETVNLVRVCKKGEITPLTRD